VSTIAVFGGYGTFGGRVCQELARRGHRVIVAGRDLQRAFALAQTLVGGPHESVRADVTDIESCRHALRGAAVAAVCAGPFSAIGPASAQAAIEGGVHHVDIADDRDYIRRLRGLAPEFAGAGRCAAFGCSSLPAVSSALALSLAGTGERPQAARVTLFIGNANPKGEASVRAMVERLGRTIRTPEGEQPGFGDPQTVVFPPPLGPRTAYTFDGPEHDLFPSLLGITAVDVRVGFELSVANAGFALLARMRAGWGARTAAVLARLANLLPRTGTSGGAVMVELAWADGRRAARAVMADEGGPRMAALPCAIVADALAAGATTVIGVRPATDVVAPPALLAELETAGLRVVDA
jgi:NAD(P)-dependent dehydrogenase (short-subunit alcohol dehydrogenase family)